MMARFRTRMIEVEAEQWRPGAMIPGVEMREMREDCDGDFVLNQAHVETPRGPIALLPGDWVVKLPDGSLDVCHDRDFTATYEPVP